MQSEIIKAIRLKEQNPVIVAYLFGVLDSGIILKERFLQVFIFGFTLILISLLGFFINEYSDKDTDSHRQDKDASKLNRSEYIFVSIIISLFILMFLRVLNFSWPIILAYFIGVAYSHPWVRLKKWFPWDQISLGLVCVVIPYITPFHIVKASVNYISLLFLIFYLGSANLVAVAKDIKADQAAGLRNTAAVLGNKGIMKWGLFNSVCFFLLGFVINTFYDFYWYYFVNVFQGILIYVFYKGLKMSPGKLEKRLIRTSKIGIKTGWILVVIQVFIIIFRGYITH